MKITLVFRVTEDVQVVEAERVALEAEVVEGEAERVEVEAKWVEVDGGRAAAVSVVCERIMRLRRHEIVETRPVGSGRRRAVTAA